MLLYKTNLGGFCVNEEVKMAIEATKKIIDKHFNKTFNQDAVFEGYQQSYLNTNEKIGSYLNYCDFTNKETALTVTAGGDHALNLITNGVLNIDTFDVNKLTEYVAFGLKFAMISKYNYYEYIAVVEKIMSNDTDKIEILSIISDLLPFMDNKYNIYWKNIIDYTYRKYQLNPNENTNIIDMLFVGPKKINSITFSNNYLLNEDFYNKLKMNITKANVTFNIADAQYLHKVFEGKSYDLILLSNILDYFYKIYGNNWSYEKLNIFLNKLKTITNDDGIIYFAYAFLYERFLGYQKVIKKNIIEYSDIHLSDLNGEEVEVFCTEYEIFRDAVGLLRVKK